MRRLLGVGVVSLALAVTAACGSTQPSTGAATGPGYSPLPTAPASVDELNDDGSTSSPTPASTLRADGASARTAAAAATAAMRLFARPSVPASTWVRELQPHLSVAAAQSYRFVDPANVPASSVTGSPKPLPQESPKVARVSVPTDAGHYLVVLSRTDEQPQWLVERITPPEEAGD